MFYGFWPFYEGRVCFAQGDGPCGDALVGGGGGGEGGTVTK